MKFTAERESLLTALQSVIGVVERRQTMPILANLLLSAEQGRLSITATDLEVELVASADIRALCSRPFACLANALGFVAGIPFSRDTLLLVAQGGIKLS